MLKLLWIYQKKSFLHFDNKTIKHTLLEILNVLQSCFNIANVILYMCCPIISMQFIFWTNFKNPFFREVVVYKLKCAPGYSTYRDDWYSCSHGRFFERAKYPEAFAWESYFNFDPNIYEYSIHLLVHLNNN